MNNRRNRTDMGCAAMLFAPILLVGVFVLANASRDSNTTGNAVWSWLLLILAVGTFAAGCIVWVRNR